MKVSNYFSDFTKLCRNVTRNNMTIIVIYHVSAVLQQCYGNNGLTLIIHLYNYGVPFRTGILFIPLPEFQMKFCFDTDNRTTDVDWF